MAKDKHIVETPLMKQYNQIKSKHPDAILLFRVGDFYETFSDDAIKTSQILGITLTQRANGAAAYIELAGFPYHALDTYLPKLVRAGQRVAICEQLEDPKKTKTIVKRGVTELVTPGVSLNEQVLDHRQNNFLGSVFIHKKMLGVAFLDISTGEFYVAEGQAEYVDKLLQSLQPKEILFERGKSQLFYEYFGKKHYTYQLDDWVFQEDSAKERLLKQFETQSLKGFGVQELQYGTVAAGAILHYLDLTEHRQTQHISKLSKIDEEQYVGLDQFTIRNLELFYAGSEDAKTLMSVMDKTMSPMGSRLLKRYMAMPLKSIQRIQDRLNIVEFFLKNQDESGSLRAEIAKIGDLERLISKAAVNRISPREVLQVKRGLVALEPIRQIISQSKEPALSRLAEQINLCTSIRERIEEEIQEDAPNLVSKGNIIKEGISKELDELRNIAFSGKSYLEELRERESERTGIPSLKISFNNVFGYYIEVRNTHKDKVPEEWIRKQTLTSGERYITPELKEYEEKILGAEDKIQQIEVHLFNELIFELSQFIPTIQVDANIIAQLDVLLSFANIAEHNQYCKPELNDSYSIDIQQGRHPVIEQQLSVGENYIANDVFLDTEKQQIIIITGPNMSGKSALLRQTALITLMAQMGSYVPAKKAVLGLVDKIFTRVGASDNISAGESTFMVEMNETASILNNLSERSLVLLDEIGRGTSTYDGISIAWALTEYIHEHPQYKAKVLFATHYHELNEMEAQFQRIKNYNVAVKEVDNKVLFIRKLIPGGTSHSFGIHVAKMAGMPKSVVKRADEILKDLEGNHKGDLAKPVQQIAQHRDGYQLSIFQLDDPVLTQIRDEIVDTDINNLTPVEALNKLNEIKKLIK
ncbi:MAG: DNA mismatch repair protein MutS [Bacteroidales bacterium]|nr:DNA mismatch repair protein MutS [Bacteroidales bacterium]